MGPPFSDGGQPVSYTNALRPGSGQQSECLSGFADAEAFYTLSPPALQEQHHQQRRHLSETISLPQVPGHLPQHQEQQQSPSQTPSTSTYDSSMPSNSPFQSRSHPFWPSPPLGPGEFDASYSYEDPSAADNILDAHYYNCSPTSPRAWSPLGSNYRTQAAAFQIRTPVSTEEMSTGTSELSTPYTGSYLHNPEHDTAGLYPTQTSPGISSGDLSNGTFGSSAASPSDPLTSTPTSMDPSMDEPPRIRHYNGEMTKPCLVPVPHDTDSSSNKKEDEPYAKLIYKAFMSQPDHCMTLQDIYQWFRDNTNKTVNEKGGWQNSIRHNLSMNAAFAKRDRKQEERSGASTMERKPFSSINESKRTNEWVLEGWAIRDGVQSTTRYRKGNSSRKTAQTSRSTGHHHPYALGVSRSGQQQQHLHSSKALSGRKGGCAARDSRLRGRNYAPGTTMLMAHRSVGMDQQQQHHGQSAQAQAHATRLTPPPHSIVSGAYTSPSDSFPLSSRIDPAMQASADMARQHHVSGGMSRASDAATAPNFGLMLVDPSLAQAPNMASDGNGNGDSNSVSVDTAVSGEDQLPMYLTHAQGDFPYGIADAHLGYPGSGQHSPMGCGSGRLFDHMTEAFGEWDESGVM